MRSRIREKMMISKQMPGEVEELKKTEDSERIMMTRCFITSVRGSITTQAEVSVKAGRLMRLSTSSTSLFYSSCLYYVFTFNFGFTLLIIISEEQHQEDLHLQ